MKIKEKIKARAATKFYMKNYRSFRRIINSFYKNSNYEIVLILNLAHQISWSTGMEVKDNKVGVAMEIHTMSRIAIKKASIIVTVMFKARNKADCLTFSSTP